MFIKERETVRFLLFYSYIHTYRHLQFEQLHKYTQNRNKIYKKWYTQKQTQNLWIYNCLVKKGMLSQKVLSHLLL